MEVRQTEPEQRLAADSDAEIYRRHAPELVRFATVLVGPDDAADVVADAFTRCISTERFDSVASPRAYLFRAVSNESKNWLRSASRRRVREYAVRDRVVIEMETPRPDVRRAIERLSVRQRAVIYLTYWHDMTDRAVGEHLGISPGTVRRHLARARKKLREVLHE